VKKRERDGNGIVRDPRPEGTTGGAPAADEVMVRGEAETANPLPTPTSEPGELGADPASSVDDPNSAAALDLADTLPDDEVMVDGGPHADRRALDGASWGRWRFNPSTNELEFHERRARIIYEIHLDKMRSSAKCLDAICQVAFKPWMTAQDRSDLLQAIRDLVRPQATLVAKRARKACREEVEA